MSSHWTLDAIWAWYTQRSTWLRWLLVPLAALVAVALVVSWLTPRRRSGVAEGVATAADDAAADLREDHETASCEYEQADLRAAALRALAAREAGAVHDAAMTGDDVHGVDPTAGWLCRSPTGQDEVER